MRPPSTPDRGLVAVSEPPGGRKIAVDVGGTNREMVLENDVVIGSVNANLRHHQAADALTKTDIGWLDDLITRRVPLGSLPDAFTARPDDVKVAITLDGSR